MRYGKWIGWFTASMIALLCALFLIRPAAEGLFESCDFETEEQALAMAMREFGYSSSAGVGFQPYQYDAIIVSRTATSVKVEITALDDKNQSYRIFLFQDCTQYIETVTATGN